MDPFEPSPPDLARLAEALFRGEPVPSDELVRRVHAELHQLAARHMASQRAGHSLQPTALVNELWLRCSSASAVRFEGTRQFFGFASKVMRSVLVDHARAVEKRERAAGRERLSISVSLDQAADPAADPADTVDLLDLEVALERLESFDPELARVVELRFFGGLTNATIAEELGVSERTVERHWRLARAWLQAELAG